MHELVRECSKCGKNLKNYKIWSRHIRLVCGPEEKRFKCIKCSFKTHRKTELEKHMKKKHGPCLQEPSLVAGAPGTAALGAIMGHNRRLVTLSDRTALITVSSKIIHVVQLIESAPRRLKLLNKISTSFDIQAVVVPHYFRRVVSVTGSKNATLYYLGTEGQIMRQLNIPSTLLPGSFSLVWLPGELDFVAILTEECVTILEVKEKQEVMALSYISVEGEALSGITFRREGLSIFHAIVLTTTGRLYHGQLDYNLAEQRLTEEIKVVITKILMYPNILQVPDQERSQFGHSLTFIHNIGALCVGYTQGSSKIFFISQWEIAEVLNIQVTNKTDQQTDWKIDQLAELRKTGKLLENADLIKKWN